MRTPKPVSRSSQAVHGLSPGSKASTAGLVRVSLVRATRLPEEGAMGRQYRTGQNIQH